MREGGWGGIERQRDADQRGEIPTRAMGPGDYRPRGLFLHLVDQVVYRGREERLSSAAPTDRGSRGPSFGARPLCPERDHRELSVARVGSLPLMERGFTMY